MPDITISIASQEDYDKIIEGICVAHSYQRVTTGLAGKLLQNAQPVDKETFAKNIITKYVLGYYKSYKEPEKQAQVQQEIQDEIDNIDVEVVVDDTTAPTP